MDASSHTSKQEEENKALALRYHDDIFQKGRLEVADEILSPDFVIHNPVLPEVLRNGPEGAKKYASAIITAVPNRKLVQNDILTEGDKVMIRWTNSGTACSVRDHYLEIPLQVMHMLQQVSISSAFQMVKSRSFGSNIVLLIGDGGYFEFQTHNTWFFPRSGSIS